MEGGVQCKWHTIEVSHMPDGAKIVDYCSPSLCYLGSSQKSKYQFRDHLVRRLLLVQRELSPVSLVGLIVKVSFCMLSVHLILLIKMGDISWQCLLVAKKAELLILLITA